MYATLERMIVCSSYSPFERMIICSSYSPFEHMIVCSSYSPFERMIVCSFNLTVSYLSIIVLPRLRVGKIRQLGCHSFILSFPWHSSLSVHNFQGAFCRATKLARPSCLLMFGCLLEEAHQTESYRHSKTRKTNLAFRQILSTAIKTLFYKENKI